MRILFTSINPVWLAVSGAVGMATMGVMSRLSGVGAEIITFYRLAVAAWLVGVLLIVLKQWNGCRPHLLTLISGILLAGFIVFYVRAMDHTTMANAVLMVYLAPPVAALAGHFIWREYLNIWQCLCIAGALFGFSMIMEFRLILTDREMKGLFFAVLALLCYATFILCNRHHRETLPPLQVIFWQLLMGALVMLFVTGLKPLYIKSSAIPWMLLTGLIPGFLALTFTVIAIQKMSTAEFGTWAYTEPVAVIVFGWLLFDESMTLLQLSGCAVIIMAGISQTLIVRFSGFNETDNIL
ncbi:MAG: DMT family transporter [Parahaliea sp.]